MPTLSSPSAQRLRQLMSLEGPKVSLVIVIKSAKLPSSVRHTDKATGEGPCAICTHTPSSSSVKTNGVLSLSTEVLLRHNHILSRLLPLSKSSDGLTTLTLCDVCLSTIKRLIDLKEEVEELQSRILAVLKLSTKLATEAEAEGSSSSLCREEEPGSDDVVNTEGLVIEVVNPNPHTINVHTCKIETDSDDEDVTFTSLETDEEALLHSDNEKLEEVATSSLMDDSIVSNNGDDDGPAQTTSIETPTAVTWSSKPRTVKAKPRTVKAKPKVEANAKPTTVKVSYNCYLCGIVLDTKRSWDKHWESCCKETFSKCYFCSKVYHDDLQAHLRSHTRERHSIQDNCGTRFRTSPNLRGRVTAVGGKAIDGHYQCHVCGKVYKRLYSLRIHIKADHGQNTLHVPFSDVKPTVQKDGSMVYSCTKCPKKNVYAKRHHLTNHMRRSHNISATKTCPICNIRFKMAEVYKAHTHPDPKDNKKVTYVCQTCGKVLEHLQKWRDHQRGYHSNDGKGFQCHQCGKVLAYEFSLNVHSKTCSVSQDEHRKCGFEGCGKVFSSRAERDDHDRVVHQRLISYRCYFCHHPHSKLITLECHLRTHTEERPFRCQKCEKEFIKAQLLKNHVASVCGTDEKKREEVRKRKREMQRAFRAKLVYGCDVCGKRYGQKPLLVSHMKREHP